jgi:non-ribosomal peptide synthetase component F
MAAAARRETEAIWWREHLAGHGGELRLPTLRRRPRMRVNRHDGVVWWGLRPELSSGLDALARRAGVTFFMSRLAVFAAQLALDTGERDLAIGSYTSGRRRAETQAMFGFFSNLTTLRLRFDPGLSFAEWLQRVRDSVVAASAHCETPYHHLQAELAADGFALPPLTTIFSVSDYPLPQRFAGLELTAMRRRMVMPWGFTWSVDRYYEVDRCLTSFDPRFHHPAKVRKLVERVQRLSERICADPESALK